MAAKTFRDLNVYMRAIAGARRIFELSRNWPPVERYSLTSQIRRSSRAVGSLVAEAWARRPYTPAFKNSVNQALGEATETQAWLDQAFECGDIDEETRNDLDDEWQRIGGMLQRMIERADEFVPRNCTRKN